ncbi:MAG: Asp-tRNA(Asn)/Glu-tRNA(Gln) amidotransferase GatCAB subunit B [Nanohaloarchaea archaeon SW_10_44_10]|nr:MAG: Asp-tRNA(Asn)/Glu-tRNA(Gln) amidotransferase GatCAB subunit B [Nanohaloarchaea archaeon SW_10_44_10]
MTDQEVDVMIGLETHVQLDTNTKLFCGCPNEEAEKPNENVCPVCLGHPGSKPRLNKNVLKLATKTVLALQCDINNDVFFSRKTYFYPDMSKNYQITQYEIPVGEKGELEIEVEDKKREIGIKRLHIEEDPAKMKHVGGSISDSNYTKVDYNRAGTPLLEIVTKPDFRSPRESREYLQQLAKILQYLEIYYPESDFAIKTDANISIEGGEKVEVKNITGTSEVEKALSYEISRQKQMKRRGREISQHTRNYNADISATEKMREKETEEDYGYIFDPDLTRQELDEGFQQEVKSSIPELPHEKYERFQKQYGISDKMIESLIAEQLMADDFEELAEEHDPELVGSWMTGELRKTLNYNELTYKEAEVELGWIEYIIGLLEEDRISDRNAEKVIREIIENPQNPKEIVENQDLLKAEEDEVDQLVAQIVGDNQEAVEDYRSGDEEAINFLVGQVMQESEGKADPKTAREKIIQKIR